MRAQQAAQLIAFPSYLPLLTFRTHKFKVAEHTSKSVGDKDGVDRAGKEGVMKARVKAKVLTDGATYLFCIVSQMAPSEGGRPVCVLAHS